MSTGSEDRGQRDLRQHVLTGVLPFWERHSIDGDHGGFITHLARDGSPTNRMEKFLVPQSRMIYSFVLGCALGGPREWLALADQGVDFICRHFRDHEHDGWFWSTSLEGRPRETDKRTYGHAFAMLALAEYARAARDTHALAGAIHTWSLLSTRLWDSEHGGLIEACDRTWRPADSNHTMGTHLHVLEALLALDAADERGRFRRPAGDICDLIVTKMVEPNSGCGLERFGPDWRPRESGQVLINYGHNLEAAWLLLRTHRREANSAYRQAARRFLDYALEYGLDRQHGGVFSHGPLDRQATEREKIWWVQTEAMVGFLLGHLEFNDPRYLEAFENVADFCLGRLYDAEHGEWYPRADEGGRPVETDKGSAWKAAYHVTQGCCYAHGYLTAMGAAATETSAQP